jgi:DNA-binding transcriptional LysR family regulator
MAVLIASVEGGSLSAAGRRLGMPLPTVSRKISDLEAHLQARLLERSTRKLTLTDAGRDYVAACKRILEQVDDAERGAAGEYAAPRGALAISAPIVYGRLHVLPVVAEFLLAFPDVDVRLQLADRVVNLQEEHVDAALRIGALPDSLLIATPVGSIHRVTCASPAYLRKHGPLDHPRELSNHPCVTFDGIARPDSWTFEEQGSEFSVPVRSRMTVNTAEAAIDAAIAGLGVTRVLSYQMESARRSGQLAVRLAAFEAPPVPVSLVHAGRDLLPLKLRAFLDFAVPRLRQRCAAAPATPRSAARPRKR